MDDVTWESSGHVHRPESEIYMFMGGTSMHIDVYIYT